MRSTLTGLVIIGIAIMIAYSSRDNTNETAGETFGTLGVILVLAIVGFSFVRAGEKERVRNKGRKKFSGGPPKGAGGKPGFPPPTGGPPQISSQSSETAQKAVAGILLVAVLIGGGWAVKTFLIGTDVGKLAEVESPKSVEKATKRLDKLLDKMASRTGRGRSDIDSAMWESWETHEKSLRSYGLKPSSFLREVLAAAPKDAVPEEVAESIAKEKPASRLARLHQKKPKPGKYPQQAEFAKYLKQLSAKTGLKSRKLTSVLVRQWRKVFKKKKRNRKYNLLWFVKHVNNKTPKKMKGGKWTVRVAEIGHAVK